ncbi:50S ribosomal protein L15 [Meiothermus sp.]|jgi:large subunit ribosomal protein L15|uniref:50S ribosomal protein L15 n=1 Tax=Meiothermus sp. TaxID=1955249 RepID=UPI0021DBEFE9|nr:50S ribosomal protein L15 [Meiothermus sp.]GIW26303.1 MAG: 50S ribosomal protein L15 [Meiothermus sp.]
MKLSDIRPNDGANKRAKRVGRGPGSGKGKTAGRGHKGQKSRSGGLKNPARFEGGRSTLIMRLPKRGMKGDSHGELKRVEYQVVNLGAIAKHFASGEVGPEALVKAGLVRPGYPVKVLAQGDAKGLKVHAHKFSQAAIEKLKAAGGEAIVLEGA